MRFWVLNRPFGALFEKVLLQRKQKEVEMAGHMSVTTISQIKIPSIIGPPKWMASMASEFMMPFLVEKQTTSVVATKQGDI